MRSPLRLSLAVCFGLLYLQSAVLAAEVPYVYIDATPSNTTLDGAALVHGTNVVNDGTSGSSSDELWTIRAVTGYENDNFFESDNANVTGDREATGNLVTTITLGAIGTYEIVAIFAKNSSRDIAAKVGAAPGAGDIFTIANALKANQSATTPEILFNNSYTNARGSSAGAAHLGQVTTTSVNQTVSIHINGLNSLSGTQDERTQYDGIGHRPYSEPPPLEPKHRDVFLFAGQSNADGRAFKSELTGSLAAYSGAQAEVLIHYTNTAYNNSDKSSYQKWVMLEPGYSVAPGFGGVLPSTTFGHEIGAAKVLATQYEHPAIIKVSRGGTALGVPGSDWYPAELDSPDVGPLYEALITSIQQALAELDAAGDTYTVHAMFWHQGESDGSRTAVYGDLLTSLIKHVRSDLELPNLRFVVGELAATKPQAFRGVQWQTARNVQNVNFLSSHGLATKDGTHFNTPSMVTFGERLGHMLLPERSLLDFETQVCATGALDRQDECAANLGLSSALEVVATPTQGEYIGGQAAGHAGATGSHFFTRRNLLPLAGARSMQADFFPGDIGFDDESDADSSMLVAGWGSDAGNDGLFSDAEAAIGFGVHQSGTFRIQIGSQIHLATPFIYESDHWYRLTLKWSESDAGGQRSVNLFARDLSTGIDLNSGVPVLSLSVSSADFDGSPARWLGLGCTTTRGLIDNIRISPPGFAAWSTILYPNLVNGPNGDDDGDGLANALEFAFGLNPLSPSLPSAFPQPVYGPNAATITFSSIATQPGILYRVLWSRDLVSWTPANSTQFGNQLEFTIPTQNEPRFFMRHEIKLTE